MKSLLLATIALFPALAWAQPVCRGTVYLTIDTGWAREAEQIAEILRRQQVHATLFLANEPTSKGDRILDPGWAAFWRARAAEGHVFATHTLRHWYIGADPGPGQVRFASRAGEGAETLDTAGFCAELHAPLDRLHAMVPEAKVVPLWRAPGGRTSPNALRMAQSCGLKHQGWTANGFLGDELDSAKSPNAALLAGSLSRIRDGEVLVMHWGVRSRRDPFVGVLEPLITGLKQRGFCFATLPADGR